MTKVKAPESRPRPWEREDRGGSFGAWLRQQREVRGVSLREIADVSRISLRYLEALEADRFDVLPAPVFARGFLREYARFVGLDPDQVVNDFIAAQQAAEPTMIDEPARSVKRSVGASPWGYGLLLTVAVLVFLGIAAVLSFYAGRRNVTTVPPAVPPPSAVRAEATPTPVGSVPAAPAPQVRAPAIGAPGSPPSAAQAPTVAAGTDRSSSGAMASTAPPPPTATAAVARPTPPATKQPPLRLSLDFSADCWVKTQIDGQRWSSKQYAAGESLVLEAQQEVLLSLGNASGVTLLVNGRPWPLPPGERNVVKDLRIDLANLSAAAALPR